MRPIEPRDTSRLGQLSAALAALLEVELGATPAAATGAAPLSAWQEWLAARGMRLVETAELPGAGFWIAAWDGDVAIMFGTPPGPVWWPGGAPEGVVPKPFAGYVVQALDPALGPLALPAARPADGVVAGVFVAPSAEAPAVAVEHAVAIAGRGLEGDRYAARAGTFSPGGGTGRDLTLVDAAALDAAGLGAGEARRNLVTRGIDVNALVGWRFRIGAEVECVGQRWCEPCRHLERLTHDGVLRALVHRGGLRADIVRGGPIVPGDAVVALQPA